MKSFRPCLQLCLLPRGQVSSIQAGLCSTCSFGLAQSTSW